MRKQRNHSQLKDQEQWNRPLQSNNHWVQNGDSENAERIKKGYQWKCRSLYQGPRNYKEESIKMSIQLTREKLS